MERSLDLKTLFIKMKTFKFNVDIEYYNIFASSPLSSYGLIAELDKGRQLLCLCGPHWSPLVPIEDNHRPAHTALETKATTTINFKTASIIVQTCPVFLNP